ncbi:MAG TPA: DNA polymerase III subunit beta [Candidatus Paceibacterota bacterium]|nr:DNA polymerase III subunit beta [Candidatus Paceibacterota bacterium]
MKLEVNKEKIVAAISKAEKIATKNSTLPALSCLLFEFSNDVLNIKSTNLDLSISVSVRIKGGESKSILVPASTLNSFILNLPKSDSKIEFDIDGNNLHITSESTDTTINTQPIDDFPIISDDKSSKSFKINSGDITKGLSSVWYSTAISSIKPELSSVYAYHDDGDLVFVATDSFRLAEKRISVKNSENFENILIPYKNVVEIVRILDDIDEEITLYFKEDKLIICTENLTIISRIVEGNFPDYGQILPKETKTVVTVLKEDLSQALKISNVFTDKFNQVIFSIFPEDGIFEINSNANGVGETKNILKSKITGENIKIAFNSKYIIDCFSSIKSDSVDLKFNGFDRPMIIQGSNDKSFLYLVSNINVGR